MGQAKLRRQIEISPRPQPTLDKAEIAAAVRASLGDDLLREGTCFQQSVVGKRVLRRFGLDTMLMAGDFQRPLDRDHRHTYTREDDRISVETGAFHAWLFCPATRDVIDFAAWQAPLRMEVIAGIPWTGPRPAYLWERESSLRQQGFVLKPDYAATAMVRKGETWCSGQSLPPPADAALFSLFGDKDAIEEAERRALAALRLDAGDKGAERIA